MHRQPRSPRIPTFVTLFGSPPLLLPRCSPSNRSLLGLNVGGGGGSTGEIRLRLRPAGRQDEFLPFDFVLGTMLHELCHNHIG